MHIKHERMRRKNGTVQTYLYAVESYWENGVSKQRRIKSYGCLERQPDPDGFIKSIEAELPQLKEQYSRNIELSFSGEENSFDADFNKVYNYGYKYLDAIYKTLNLDKYLDGLQAEIGGKAEYRVKDIFKFLVFERILNPDSKRATVQRAHEFFGFKCGFSLDDIYRCMTLLAPKFDEIQDHIKRESDKLIKRDYSKVYYDCTNYYCEIDYSDTVDNLRHRGVSKEHRVDPIIGFGLFLDNNGLPLKCQVFNGNVAECKMLIPGIRAVKAAHDLPRIVMVADKGLNTLQNIEELVKNGDGYVFSQILRGKKGKRFHEHIFSKDGYTEKLDEQKNIEYKYKIIEEDYSYTDKDGNEIPAKRKALLYYSRSEDRAAKRKRAEKLLKAERSLTNAAYGIKHGYDQYVKEDLIDGETGEILNDKLIISKSVDIEKAQNDERFDGYYCLITSELDYSEKQIRDTYSQLWEIEQTFRITKSDLEFRPVYHYKKENIMTHFLICYCAVFILRLLQQSLKTKGVSLSAERIVNALNSMNCENLKGIIKLSKPPTTETFNDFKNINKASNLKLEHPLLKLETFRQLLTRISCHSITA